MVLDEDEKDARLKLWPELAARLDLEPVASNKPAAADHAQRLPAGGASNEATTRWVVGLELLPYDLRGVLVDESGEAVGNRSVQLDNMQPGDVANAALLWLVTWSTRTPMSTSRLRTLL